LKRSYISIIQDVKTNIPEIGCKGKIYLAVKGRLLLIFSQEKGMVELRIGDCGFCIGNPKSFSLSPTTKTFFPN
jgi:hypothetical protein